jgi:hypothetical protein
LSRVMVTSCGRENMSVTSSLSDFTTAVWRLSFHVSEENPKR